MQSQYTEPQYATPQADTEHHQIIETSEVVLSPSLEFAELDDAATADMDVNDPTRFHGQFEDCMEMYADAKTVAEYLIDHHGWFPRCALPMQASSISEHGYEILIGRFGSYGYVVEPRVGLELLPPDREGVYRIRTIDVPGYEPQGYAVDFKASLQLKEIDPKAAENADSAGSGADVTEQPKVITRVEWELDLTADVWFPKFIHILPQGLIQSTGERLLKQIVKQFSRRLTRKVQTDFHTVRGLTLPQKSHSPFPWMK